MFIERILQNTRMQTSHCENLNLQDTSSMSQVVNLKPFDPDVFDIICIQNYGGSGTMLIHSLLDNHPQILQLPGLIGIQYFTLTSLFFDRNTVVSVKMFEDHLLNLFASLYKAEKLSVPHGLTYLGDNADEHCAVEEESFVKYLKSVVSDYSQHHALDTTNCGNHRLKFIKLGFTAVYHAYCKCLGLPDNYRTKICYPIHSADEAEVKLVQILFNRCTFLHSIRHPVENMDSCTKYYLRQQKYFDLKLSPFSCGIAQLFLDAAPHMAKSGPLYGAIKYPDFLNERDTRKEFAITLEDLHKQPEYSLQILCNELGIEWHESLMRSTFAGKTWWNRPGLKRVTGFTKGITERKKLTHFTNFDRWRLAAVGRKLLTKQGYLKPPTMIDRCFDALAIAACFLPFKLEFAFNDYCRDIYFYCGDNKHRQNLKTVAQTYWDARRKTCGSQFHTINEEAEKDPTFQRLFMLSVNAQDEVVAKRLHLEDLPDYRFAQHVIFDINDNRIPNITTFIKIKARLKNFLLDYMKHRKLLFRSYKHLSRVQDDILAPLNKS